MRTALRPRVRLILASITMIALATTAACAGATSRHATEPTAPTTLTTVAAVQTVVGPSTTPPASTKTPLPTAPPPAPTTAVTTASAGSFSATVAPVSAGDLPFSWRPGCPVGPDRLRLLRLSFWGFDNQAHQGTIVVNVAVTADVQKIFARLFAQHFPIHQMQPIDVFHGSDVESMDADNTSGFNCRYAVAPGPRQWSVHAFGEAIDVNTVENPYLEPGQPVEPPAGAAYLDRSDIRPGMAISGGPLVAAFSEAGWLWGGRWTAGPDYQHFSKTGG